SGCNSTSTPIVVTVTAAPPLAITPSGATTFCAGGSVTLTATAGFTGYSWSNGGTGPSITVNASGSYSVSATSGSCNVTSAATVVNVTPLPSATISASGPTTFCTGGSVVLSAPAGLQSYLWSTGATTQSLAVNASGSYSVVVTDAAGCSGTSAPTVVSVSPAPATTITPSGPTTFCAGGSVTLTATAGVSYLWSTGATTQSIAVTAPGAFSVTTTYAGGCFSTSPNVVVSTIAAPPLTVTASGPTTFCLGGNVTLTASSGFTGYLWSNGATTQSITVNAAGSYSVTASTPSCSVTSASTVVAIGAATPATITASGPTSFCTGGSVTLTANAGGTSYLWTNGATTQSITVSAGGTFGVVVTYSGGCTSVATPVAVSVTAPPAVTIAAAASVNAGSSGNNASVAAGPAGTTYAWTIAGGTILSGHGTPSISFSAGSSATVALTVTVTTNGCSTVAATSIPVNGTTPPPPVKKADLGIAVSAPSAVAANGTVTYAIAVTNAGPDPAVNVTLSDFNDNGAMTSLSGAGWSCSTSISGGVCSMVSLPVGASTLTATVTAPAIAGTIHDTASISSPTSDPNGANNEATVTTAVTEAGANCAGIPPSLIAPADGAANVASPVTFSWSTVAGASQYELWIANGGGSPSLAGSTPSTSLTLTVPGGELTWYVIADFAEDGCTPLVSAQRRFNVTGGTNCGTHGAPSLLAPNPGANVPSPVTFQWMPVPQAIGYRVWFSVDGGAAQDAGTTDGATQLHAEVAPGAVEWFVDALFNACPSTRSQTSRFNVVNVDACAGHTAAVPTAPADKSSLNGSSIDFRWTAAQGANGYRVWGLVDGGVPTLLGTTDAASLKAPIPGSGIEWYVETLFDGCPSLFSGHRTLTVVRSLECGTEVSSLIAPADGASTPGTLVNFVWSEVPEATGYELWLGLNSGARVLVGTTPGQVTSLTREAAAGDLEWFVRARFDGCVPRDSRHATFRVEPRADCTGQRPLLTAPFENAAGVLSPVTFRWAGIAGGSSYRLYIGKDGATPSLAGTTNATSLANVSLPAGRIDWFVEATLGSGCPAVRSTTRAFTVVAASAGCTTPEAPSALAPSEVSSNVRYAIQWQPVAGATSYVVQESATAGFGAPASFATTGDRVEFQHANDSTELATFFYRIRASSSCASGQGAYSPIVGVGILPSSSGGGKSVAGALPVDATQVVTYTIPLAASLAGQTFVATPNQPWITVTPSSGTVANGGTVLNVVADTNGLPIGTSLGGVTLTFGANNAVAGGVSAHAAAPSSTTTISMSKVAPVMVNPKTAPPPDALIIPAVAHADGVNSKFVSDVRITNTAPQVMKYQLTFTPSGDEGIKAGKQTQIEIDPGRTIAIDDVLASWFSTGTASATGVLEVRPLTQVAATTSSAALSSIPNIVTFASSRTFNTTANGTFGQYIPAIPFANFIGKAPGAGNALSSILSLQQIAQSDAFRTNLGLVEGSGEPASLLVSVFGSTGLKLTEFPVDLKGGQHLQLNSFIADKGLQVTDGRIEVKVTSPGGKVTAYASVLDNRTNDPLLVTPVTMSEAGSSKYVIAGVADLNNGLANWRTDVRVYNNSANTVDATLKFVSQNGGEAKAVPLSLAPGEVKQLDSVLASLFGATNDGGALHLTTPNATSLIATARTYNQTANGTYGQFISAVTPDGAIGNGSRPLQLLQVEESDRYRSNIGVAEVAGKPATIEVTAVPPDSKVAGILRFDLAPNQFIQYNALLRSLNMENTYNARITVKVTGGSDRVTAYASVI
ncbi:MAG: domain containing protein, partial [Acidobacteria bacterium]|nr:domain containing protein [Acidobacteriota bacterium]